MKCAEYQNDLTAWLDKELDPRRSRDIRLHLENCISCREELHRHRSDRAWWGSLPPESNPSPLLWQTIQAALSTDPAPRQKAWILGIYDFFLPDFSFSWSRALTAISLAGLLLLGSMGVLTLPVSSLGSAETAMQDYVQWRTREADALRRPLSATLSMDELKAGNPFLDFNHSSSRTNPFIPG